MGINRKNIYKSSIMLLLRGGSKKFFRGRGSIWVSHKNSAARQIFFSFPPKIFDSLKHPGNKIFFGGGIL